MPTIFDRLFAALLSLLFTAGQEFAELMTAAGIMRRCGDPAVRAAFLIAKTSSRAAAAR